MSENEQLENNKKLVYMVLYKHFRLYVNDEDLFQIGMIGLLKAIRSYKADTYKFSTYAARCIYNAIAQEFQRQNCEMRTCDAISLDAEQSKDGNLNLYGLIEDKMQNQSETVMIINQYLNKLTGRQKQIFELIVQEYNYSEIGEKLGLSRERIRQLSTEIINKLDIKLGGVKNGRKRRHD